MNAITEAELEKWELLFAASNNALHAQCDGTRQLHEFEIPETRRVYVDYCPEINPGTFGKLAPGRYEDCAFVALERIKNRDFGHYEIVSEGPRVWKVGLSTGKMSFRHSYGQSLTYPVHLSKRFLQLSCSQKSDDVVFAVEVHHTSWYAVAAQPPHGSPPENPPPISEIFASEHETDGIVLSCCIPGLCPSSCDVHPKGEFSINETDKFTVIHYVRLPARQPIRDQGSHGVVKNEDIWYEDIVRAHEFEFIPYGCSPKLVNKDLFPSAEWS